LLKYTLQGNPFNVYKNACKTPATPETETDMIILYKNACKTPSTPETEKDMIILRVIGFLDFAHRQ
jgi:hypothetical protein